MRKFQLRQKSKGLLKKFNGKLDGYVPERSILSELSVKDSKSQTLNIEVRGTFLHRDSDLSKVIVNLSGSPRANITVTNGNCWRSRKERMYTVTF